MLVLRHTAGPIRTLTLNRPEKRNALSADLVAALQAALDEAAHDDAVRVVVLAGAGPVFSAGADLAALERLQSATAEANLADSEALARLFDAIAHHPKPIIARLHGHAVAGGCGLAAVCDFSLATPDVNAGFTEVRIGFVPALVAVFLRRKLGEAALRDLLLRGGLVRADDAVRIGLFTRVVAADRLDDEVEALARELATETSASAVRLTKRLLADLPGMGYRESLSYAAQLNAFARSTADCHAGIAAFLRKEPPPWRDG